MKCSFCGIEETEVKKLLRGDNPHVAICDSCIEIGYETLNDEEFTNVKIDLNPKSIKKELDRYVIGQELPKKVLSVAIYNHLLKVQKNLTNVQKGNVLLIGPTGSGKAQPLYSKIKTPNGWTNMGNIKVGDKVCTPDGNVSNITGLFPQGIKNVYRVNFKDGRYTDCCEDHLWKVYNKDWKNKYKILSLKKINNYLNNKKSKIYTQLIEYTSDNDVKLPIDPYVLGSLISNGHIKKDIRISNSNKIFIKKFTNKLIENYKLRNDKKGDYTIVRDKINSGHNLKKGEYLNHYKIKLNELELLGKLSYEKFIPKIYLESSYNQRIQLLNGLIDNDGYISKSSNIEYYTSSHQLALDFQYLIRSIGGLCSITNRIPKYKYNNKIMIGKKAYRCHVRFQNPSLLVTTKFESRLKKNLNIKLKNQIISIEYIGKEECQCILIDHPDHLYITDDFIVTHNTCLVHQIAKQITAKGDVVFDCKNPRILTKALENFREVEPTRPIVCIFEDLDSIIRDYGDDDLLKMLDGENLIDRVLNIATTNYPEYLDRRLVGRPRRFDRVIKIDMPSKEQREIFFKNRLLKEDIEKIPFDKWVESTDQFPFSALAELIVSVLCLDNEFDEMIEVLKKLVFDSVSSEDYAKPHKTGF